MNKLEFLFERYYKELERQNSLNESLNMPVGLITGLSALLFFLVNEFTFSDNNLSTVIPFLFFTLAALLCCLKIVYHLFYSYNNLLEGYTYALFPYPSVMDTYYETISEYVNNNQAHLDPNTTAEKLYGEQVQMMLTEYIETNIQNNDTKSTQLHISKRYLLLCLILTILSLIPFGVNYITNKKSNQPQEIIIKNISELKNHNDKINSIMSDTKPTKPQTPPPPPPRLVKEGHQPPPPPKPPKREQK